MKRRWIQIHLSTAIVLSIIAGVLLWRNVVPRHVVWYDPIIRSHGQAEFHRDMLDGKFLFTGWSMVVTRHPSDPNTGPLNQPNFFIPATINLIAGAAILILAATAIEFLIRRRKRGRA